MTIKLIVLGTSGAGKTELIRSLTPDLFKCVPDGPTHAPDFYDALLTSEDGGKYPMEIWDASGDPKLFRISLPYLKDASAILLVFSVCSRDSFVGLQSILDIYFSSKLQNRKGTPVILVGTQVDRNNERKIDYGSAFGWAKRAGCRAYFETAALSAIRLQNLDQSEKFYINLFNAFCEAAQLAIENGDDEQMPENHHRVVEDLEVAKRRKPPRIGESHTGLGDHREKDGDDCAIL